MNASPTFACPWCGAPISGSTPGATFACPYCQAKVTAPYAGEPVASLRQGAAFLPQQERAEGPFTADADDLCLAHDPRLGFVLVGPHSPHGQPPQLRAYSLQEKRVLWESQKGQTWVADVDLGQMHAHGPNVYVANNRSLLALSLATGDRRWAGQLSDKVDEGDWRTPGACVVDAFAPEGRGAVLVRAVDNVLHAFDRDTGQPLYQRAYKGDFSMQPLVGHGIVALRHNSPYVRVDLMNPGYPQLIRSLGADQHWSCDFDRSDVVGRSLLCHVEDYGPEDDEEGVMLVDGPTGQQHFFSHVENLDSDVAGTVMGTLVFCSVDDGKGMWVGPQGGRLMGAPVPNHKIVALVAGGPTLFVLLTKAQGTEVRRLVGLDPITLGFRFDCGEQGAEPDEGFGRQVQTNGYIVVIVASENDDEDQCELRAYDTTSGRMIWRRPVGAWLRHHFQGGWLVSVSRGKVEILDPRNGQAVAGYP